MEPPFKRVRQENKTGWFDLPYDMRRMILDMIEIEDLIKFSSCSKQCGEEAWESKNGFKEIYLSESSFSMSLRFSEPYYYQQYQIEFENRDITTTDVILRAGFFLDRKRTREVNKPRNEVVLEYLQLFLRRIGRNLRVLRIDVKPLLRDMIVRHVQIRNLRKLDELTLEPCSGDRCCPLDMKFVDMEQLTLVKERLEIDGMIMTFERLLEMKANNIHVSYEGLSPEDLNKYMKMWVNGELHKNFESLEVETAYDRSEIKRRIKWNLDGLKPSRFRYGCYKCFYLKPSCESLKHLTAQVSLDKYGRNFLFVVDDGAENDD